MAYRGYLRCCPHCGKKLREASGGALKYPESYAVLRMAVHETRTFGAPDANLNGLQQAVYDRVRRAGIKVRTRRTSKGLRVTRYA